jgi:hypothetical protein
MCGTNYYQVEIQIRLPGIKVRDLGDLGGFQVWIPRAYSGVILHINKKKIARRLVTPVATKGEAKGARNPRIQRKQHCSFFFSKSGQPRAFQTTWLFSRCNVATANHLASQSRSLLPDTGI